MKRYKLSSEQVEATKTVICDELGVDKSQAFLSQFDEVYLRFSKEIEDRSISLNEMRLLTNMSVADYVIKEHWDEIPDPVKKILMQNIDDTLAYREK